MRSLTAFASAKENDFLGCFLGLISDFTFPNRFLWAGSLALKLETVGLWRNKGLYVGFVTRGALCPNSSLSIEIPNSVGLISSV